VFNFLGKENNATMRIRPASQGFVERVPNGDEQ
jgi:hypothetical protein